MKITALARSLLSAAFLLTLILAAHAQVPLFNPQSLSNPSLAPDLNALIQNINKAINAVPAGTGTIGSPTAVAKDTAVIGTSGTVMASDSAPAIQKGSDTQFGIFKVDGTTVLAAGGVLSSVGGGGLTGLTSGQVPIANSATTANASLPLAGTSPTAIATFAGSAPATNDCAKFDVNKNVVGAGAACGTATLPSIANVHVLGNATGGAATAADTTLTNGTGIGITGTGGTITIANTAPNGLSGLTNGGVVIANSATTAAGTLPTATTGNSTILQSDSSGNAKAPVNTTTGVFSSTMSVGGVLTYGGAAPGSVTNGWLGVGAGNTIVSGTPPTVLPSIANLHVLGNASGAPATAVDTTLAAGTGISLAGAGGTATITNSAPNGLSGLTPGGVPVSATSTTATSSLPVSTTPAASSLVKSGSDNLIDAGFLPQAIHRGATTATITAAQWKNGDVFIVETAGQVLTLPVATSLSTGGNITVVTIGVTASLVPNAADGINGGSVGAGVVIPSSSTVAVTTSGSSGTTAFAAPLGPIRNFALSWGAAQNLATPTTNGIPIGRVEEPRTIVGIKCLPTVVVGGTSTFDVYAAASATALGSGTKLNTTACNANTGAGTEQDMAVSAASVAAGSWIGVVATGAGWGSSAGWGALNVSFR